MAEPQMCEPEEFNRSFSIWNPGGDPDALRRAADAWDGMAGTIETQLDTLEGAISGVVGSAWTGDAANAFVTRWSELRCAVQAAVGTCREVAAELRRIADEIQRTNELVRQIYAAIGATIAVGVLTSVVTLGFGTAGAAAAATAQASRAATIVAQLGNLLTVSVRSMSAFRAAGILTLKNVGTAFGLNVTVGMTQRALFTENHNPLAGWRLEDIRNLVVGTAMGASVHGAVRNSANLRPWATAHPVASTFGTGFGAGAATTFTLDGLDGRLGGATLGRATVNGLVSGTVGAGTRAAVDHWRPAASPYYRPEVADGWVANAPTGGRLIHPPAGQTAPVQRVELWTPPAPQGATLAGRLYLPGSGVVTPTPVPGTIRTDAGLLAPAPPPGAALHQPAPPGLTPVQDFGVRATRDVTVREFRRRLTGSDDAVPRFEAHLPGFDGVTPPPPPPVPVP